MKTLWAALNAQTLLRRAFSASWLKDVSLPPCPLCRYHVVSLLSYLSLVPFWLPAGAQEQSMVSNEFIALDPGTMKRDGLSASWMHSACLVWCY